MGAGRRCGGEVAVHFFGCDKDLRKASSWSIMISDKVGVRTTSVRGALGQGIVVKGICMVAPLVPGHKIPELAKHVDTVEKFKVLRRVKHSGGVLMKGDVDQATTAILKQFSDGLLVDPGYAGSQYSDPDQWVINGNGERVLKHLEAQLAGSQDDDAPPTSGGTYWIP
jgi:hypothetical protein